MKIYAITAFCVVFLLTSFVIQRCEAADLYLGGNLSHISQFDAGYPFNDNYEDSVDHVGLHATVRFDSGFFFGVSAGQNTVLSDCACTWDDGGAEIDTMLMIGWEAKVFSW